MQAVTLHTRDASQPTPWKTSLESRPASSFLSRPLPIPHHPPPSRCSRRSWTLNSEALRTSHLPDGPTKVNVSLTIHSLIVDESRQVRKRGRLRGLGTRQESSGRDKVRVAREMTDGGKETEGCIRKKR
ncbi:hypothetical protein E2C01_023670 [Portunus trituberculatus]|uniref:Uncharacterized protein n=1 Tax=Portunus trituberculatus TaxID=210409 RepID=A0A5B7EB68_PORTR|nr:hypothetical protein [Portunus trituberculatus]